MTEVRRHNGRVGAGGDQRTRGVRGERRILDEHIGRGDSRDPRF